MCLSGTSVYITGIEGPQPHQCAGLVQPQAGGGTSVFSDSSYSYSGH